MVWIYTNSEEKIKVGGSVKDIIDVLLVALGGGLGSTARYLIGLSISENTKKRFPLNTFIVNILGAFFLGFFNSSIRSHDMGLLIADGFLGAFTTFSAFMLEGHEMLGQKRWVSIVTYLISTVVFGLLGYAMGLLF